MNARDILLGGVAAVALGTGLLGAAKEAKAQATAPGVAVQQSPQRLDASQVVQGTTAANCTTTQVAVASNTFTFQPPSGQYLYLTGAYIEVAGNGTGAQSAVGWSTTNLNGVAWLTTGAVQTTALGAQEVAESYSNPLKSSQAGLAVVITPTATMASNYQCAKFTGYYGP